jgi:ADP-ribosylglycohydrolase
MPNLHHIPISYIKKPFLWSLYYLKNNWTYKKAIKDVIFRGGDIRSNAAIVGGLIGAVKGKNRKESKYY